MADPLQVLEGHSPPAACPWAACWAPTIGACQDAPLPLFTWLATRAGAMQFSAVPHLLSWYMLSPSCSKEGDAMMGNHPGTDHSWNPLGQ